MHLQRFIVAAILSAITFLASECWSQLKPEEVLVVKEAQEARRSAEKRALELELELRKLRGEHDALRSRYAALYVENHKVLTDLRRMESDAAHLIRRGENNDSAQADVLEILNLLISRQIKVKQTLLEYEKCISSVMEVLQPSEALRKQLNEGLKKLEQSVEASLEPTPEVARNIAGDYKGTTGQVLSIEEKEEAVILDKGVLAGVRTGQVWYLQGNDGRALVKFVTITCRPDFCAAILTEGSIKMVAKGSVLVRE